MSIQSENDLWNKLGSTAEITNSENGTNGAVNGTITHNAGKFGNASLSNNTANYIKFTSVSGFNADIWAIEFWYRPVGYSIVNGDTSDNNFHCPFAFVYNSQNFIQATYNPNQNSLFFNIRVSNINNFFSMKNHSVADGTLAHYLIVYDRTNGIGGGSDYIRLYVDGALAYNNGNRPFSQGNPMDLYFLVCSNGSTQSFPASADQDNLKLYSPAGGITEQLITDILANRENEGWPVSGRQVANRFNFEVHH